MRSTFFTIYVLFYSIVFAGNSNKEVNCAGYAECLILRDKINTKIYQLQTETANPIANQIITYKDGTPKQLTQSEAREICSKNNMRLPTARELATMIVKKGNGAQLLESKDEKITQSKEKYKLIYVKNSDGSIDLFYFHDEEVSTENHNFISDSLSLISSKYSVVGIMYGAMYSSEFDTKNFAFCIQK